MTRRHLEQAGSALRMHIMQTAAIVTHLFHSEMLPHRLARERYHGEAAPRVCSTAPMLTHGWATLAQPDGAMGTRERPCFLPSTQTI